MADDVSRSPHVKSSKKKKKSSGTPGHSPAVHRTKSPPAAMVTRGMSSEALGYLVTPRTASMQITHEGATAAQAEVAAVLAHTSETDKLQRRILAGEVGVTNGLSIPMSARGLGELPRGDAPRPGSAPVSPRGSGGARDLAGGSMAKRKTSGLLPSGTWFTGRKAKRSSSISQQSLPTLSPNRALSRETSDDALSGETSGGMSPREVNTGSDSESVLHERIEQLHMQLQMATSSFCRVQMAEIMTRKRVEELEEREAELLKSYNSLSTSLSRPKLSRKKKRRRDCIQVDTSRLQVCSRLGAGGSGTEVYSCNVDGWICAMKQLTVQVSSQFEVQAFEREMALLYQLPPHPNIIRYLFHEQIGGKMCLFMTRHERTLREHLNDLIAKGKHMESNELCHCALEIANGIAFLHANHIIHRDIKSDNIFITHAPTGELQEVVVADFDTAIKTGVANLPTDAIGTLGYIAPEMLTNDKSYSFAVDVYSFGMLLYELMTLRRPFDDAADRGPQFSVIDAVKAGDLPKLDPALVEYYGTGLNSLYICCTAQSPKTRPSFSALKEALRSMKVESLEAGLAPTYGNQGPNKIEKSTLRSSNVEIKKFVQLQAAFTARNVAKHSPRSKPSPRTTGSPRSLTVAAVMSPRSYAAATRVERWASQHEYDADQGTEDELCLVAAVDQLIEEAANELREQELKSEAAADITSISESVEEESEDDDYDEVYDAAEVREEDEHVFGKSNAE